MNIPDYCFSLLNTSIDPNTKIGKVIRLVAFEEGYYPTHLEQTQEEVDEFNLENLGVDKATARAMETASMFGWQAYLPTLKSYQKLEKEKNK